MNRRGSILIGLLWCLSILSILVVSVLHTSTLDARLSKNFGDEIQARYLALAGLEKAKALLYHEAWERRRSHVHHSGKLENAPEHFRDVTLGRGMFRVIRQGSDAQAGQLAFGVLDEEARLNVNLASAEELLKLPYMTEELAAAIVDYRDGNRQVTQAGAELEQYAASTPPRRPRDGPFLTRRELRAVLGISLNEFLGEDYNANGLLDENEDDGEFSLPQDDGNGRLRPGWLDFITIDSQVRNVNAAGQSRVNIQEADAAELSTVPGISSELAEAITRYRENNEFENLADLLEVRPVNSNGRNNTATAGDPVRGPAIVNPDGSPINATGASQNPQGPQNASGQPLINESLFMEIADDLTLQSDMDLPGRININTASEEVLMCLPGITRELAYEIAAHRRSAGYFANIARLLEVPGMTRQVWEGISERIAAGSQTFRVLSEGVVPATGARRRVQATVRVGTFYVDTLTYREDDL